jgi:hypothetical protein
VVVTAFGFVTLFVSALPLPLEIVPLCGAGILLVASTALLALPENIRYSVCNNMNIITFMFLSIKYKMNYLLIKLVVVFFGPAAGVAEFIVSFRTFFSGCICTNKKMLKLSNKLLDGYKLSWIV